MALAKKCDRCGNFYEHYPNGDQPGAWNAIKYVRVSSNGSICAERNRFDLCPRCLESFDSWLKMEFEQVFAIKDDGIHIGREYKEEENENDT